MSEEHEQTLAEIQKEWHGNVKAYTIGFFGSIFLTALSFLAVMSHKFGHTVLTTLLVILAIVQGALQARYFLHVGEEPKPKWESGLFFFMIFALLIIVVGSVWIMFDLNNRVMQGMEGM